MIRQEKGSADLLEGDPRLNPALAVMGLVIMPLLLQGGYCLGGSGLPLMRWGLASSNPVTVPDKTIQGTQIETNHVPHRTVESLRSLAPFIKPPIEDRW